MGETLPTYFTRNALPRRRSHHHHQSQQQLKDQTTSSSSITDTIDRSINSSITPSNHEVYPTSQQQIQRTNSSRTTTNNNNNHNNNSNNLSNSIHSTVSTTNGNNNNNNKFMTLVSRRQVRRVMKKRKNHIGWGPFRKNTNIEHDDDDDNDKYRTSTTSKSNMTATFILSMGLFVVGLCTLLLVWNVHFKSSSSMMMINSTRKQAVVVNNHNDTSLTKIVSSSSSKSGTNLLQIFDSKLSSSSTSTFTGLRANIITSNTTTTSRNIQEQQQQQQPLPTSIWVNDLNVVHVIQTRFMQNQPNLIALGQARLQLFLSITIPSIQHQTIQQFVWIIRTDPNLHSSILIPLIDAISKLPNAILVASNRNPEGWRDKSCISDITKDTILVGNYEYVQSYYDAAQTHTVLETRCDADDAIAIDFVELVQTTAISGLHPLYDDWIVYCADNHMEWQYDNPWLDNDTLLSSISNGTSSGIDIDRHQDKPSIITNKEKGALLVLRAGRCVTPGLTWGYTVNASRSDIPVSKHQKIQKIIKPCGARIGLDGVPLRTKCLIKLGGDFPLALRARTPTSAGMDHVFMYHQTEQTFPLEHLQKSKFRTLQNELWSVLFVLFGINSEDLWNVRSFISNNLLPIARDALDGQCTQGHSCKDSSKEILQNILNIDKNDLTVNQTEQSF